MADPFNKKKEFDLLFLRFPKLLPFKSMSIFFHWFWLRGKFFFWSMHEWALQKKVEKKLLFFVVPSFSSIFRFFLFSFFFFREKVIFQILSLKAFFWRGFVSQSLLVFQRGQNQHGFLASLEFLWGKVWGANVYPGRILKMKLHNFVLKHLTWLSNQSFISYNFELIA